MGGETNTYLTQFVFPTEGDALVYRTGHSRKQGPYVIRPTSSCRYVRIHNHAIVDLEPKETDRAKQRRERQR